MVKHMLRTNLLTLDKKSFLVLESLFAVLLCEDSFKTEKKEEKKKTTLCR